MFLVTPDMAALEDEAPVVEWAEKTEVSTPAERRCEGARSAARDSEMQKSIVLKKYSYS